MKVLGIIVEFNPLHHGHLHFLESAKEKVKPDLVVAVVSNHFSMRGDIMVMDKYTKTNLMLDLGIDLVLELPYISATQSADLFAYNAVSILHAFGVTDIVFGSESGDLEHLFHVIDLTNQDTFQSKVKSNIDLGHSYPVAHQKALEDFTTDEQLLKSYQEPNNILAIQYIKSVRSINPSINLHTIPRIIASYHEVTPHHETITSATAIRNLMIQNKDINAYIGFDQKRYQMVDLQVASENLNTLLRYQLSRKIDFTRFLGVTEGIENRLIDCMNQSITLDDLINLSITKRYTKSRIKRTLLHLLLEVSHCYANQANYYLRILGMSGAGIKHINTLPKDTKDNIISNVKTVYHPLVELEKKVTNLFGIITEQYHLSETEYKYPIKKEGNDVYDSKRN
jgi:predicted nucleotidyltransferase